MSVAVSDVSKLSDVNEVIKENLAMIETQVLKLGDRLFGGETTPMEQANFPESVIGTMNENLDRSQRIKDILSNINEMI